MQPPRDIAPQTFFEEWLPGAYASIPEERRAHGVKVRVRLDGDGGGAWDLHLERDRLDVRRPADGELPVTLHQSVEDWRAITFGEEGAPPLAPPQSGGTEMLFLDEPTRRALAAVRGTVLFEVSEYRGRTWRLTLKLGDQPMPPGPGATISVDAATYAQMVARKLAPPEAYFAGRIRIGGDTGLAMQLAMAMLPRFTK
jgi:hypothetical protein